MSEDAVSPPRRQRSLAGQAALYPELENQAHRQEEGRGVCHHGTVALSF